MELLIEPDPDQIGPIMEGGNFERSATGQLKAGSEHAGVTFDKDKRRWRARGSLKRKNIFLGLHTTELAAALAYDAWAQDKEGKALNYPTDAQKAVGRGDAPRWRCSL